MLLFQSDETAFVAFERVDVGRLRRVMEHLGLPVHAHVVSPDVVDELLARVYGGEAPEWS